MAVQKITTHQADAEARLLSQSRRPLMRALLGAMTSQVQAAEDAVFPLLDGRFLSKAVGAQLDGLGQLVGQPRNGQSDDVYRLFLQGRIFANSSDSSTLTIQKLAQTLFAAKSVQVVSEASPGFAHRRAPGVLGLEIGSPSLDRSLWQQAITLIQQSFAAAIRLSWVTVYDVDATFALDGLVVGQPPDGHGTTAGMAEEIYRDMGA